MRVSTKSDYALRALIEISRQDDVISAEQVGASQDIPSGYLQSILADLRRAGIVASQRGQSGGWRMAVDPASVSVADVIRAVDGPLLSVYGVRPEAVSYNESAAVLQTVWVAARSSLRSVLEAVTIAALVSGKLPDDVMARTADEDAWNPH
jgi:Rrf2 family protein